MYRLNIMRLIAMLAALLMLALPVLAEPVEACPDGDPEPAVETPGEDIPAEPVESPMAEYEAALADDAEHADESNPPQASNEALPLAAAELSPEDALPVETPTPAETVSDAAPSTETPVPVETLPESTPTPEPVIESDPGRRVFDATATVDSETWSDIDLARAEGFAGKLATVNGKLILSNVTIEGQPARDVNLLDHFDLGTGAVIEISDSAAMSLDASAMSLNRGAVRTMHAYYDGHPIKAGKVKWKSSSKKLAVVSKKGRVKGKARGVAVITASYKGQTAACYLDVTGVVYPKSVHIKKKLKLGINNTMRLKAKLKPANPDDPTLTWTSSQPEIVSVDDQGNVTALTVGKATVSVTTSNGKTAACRVTVKPIKLKSLGFQRLYVTLHPDECYQSVLTMKPRNSTYPAVSYASTDPAVASVDENGLIVANACGTATITVTSAANPAIHNTCKVCVIPEDAAQLEGLVIGINPGHQATMIKKRYPMAPGSSHRGPGVKVGAVGKSTHQREYNVVLKVGLKLKRILEEHGATVVITRTTNDVMLTNIDRARMLNEAGVDVALQLHCNSCSNSSKTGSSSYFRPNGPWAEENRALAIKLSRNISRVSGFKNRGINPYTDYMSLNWTTTPSVLLEMGYLSNSSDDHKLARDDFQEKLAQGIYEGLCAYFGR